MRVLITGAGGFVGRRLARRLVAEPGPFEQPVRRVVLLDQRLDDNSADPRVERYVGSIADAELLGQALADHVDVVFHLASVPGGLAERNYELGRQVNLDATFTLLERLRRQPRPPIVVFASSIAVYGSPLPELVDDATLPRPQLSYGAQKLIGEVLVSDCSRRGWIDGISLRLPGIVARPAEPSGLLSAFMSNIFWKFAAGEPFICPVSPRATAWWMSVECCVANLLHAARLAPAQRAAARVVSLPVLRLTIAELVDGLARRYGEDRRGLVRYEPEEAIEAGFGRYPPLDTRVAAALGFCDDGDVERLIANAVAPL